MALTPRNPDDSRFPMSRRRRRSRRSVVAAAASALLLAGTALLAAPAAAQDDDPTDEGGSPIFESLPDELDDFVVPGFEDFGKNAPPNNMAPAEGGQFSAPFASPYIETSEGKVFTDQRCVRKPEVPDSRANDPTYNGLRFDCKPTAVSTNVLPTGDVMYYNGLDGGENVKYQALAEFGHNSDTGQSEVLSFDGSPSPESAGFSLPENSQGGANPDGISDEDKKVILPERLVSDETYNDGALFCSTNIFTPDGRVIAIGGTAYYNEPNVSVGEGEFGFVELRGIKNTRIFDPADNTWKQTGSMHVGRWYPTAVTMAGGDILVASGVQKLIKPIYNDEPFEHQLTNVQRTETYDTSTGQWTLNPESANRSLPLYPRLHLLPNGEVFYGANGQAFNPNGFSKDQFPRWDIASVYDPEAQNWRDLGIPGLGQGPPDLEDLAGAADLPDNVVGIPGGGEAFTFPGFRGTTMESMLTLRPDENGEYTKAQFLAAGGVIQPESPGSFVATNDTRLTTIDTSSGEAELSVEATEDLPKARVFVTPVEAPTGDVFAFNGNNVDDVVVPGVEVPNKRAMKYDPETGEWTELSNAHNQRIYHSSAVLLPSGEMLIGGSAPIATGYTGNVTIPGGITAEHDGRDPSFEVYRPPYLFNGPQPVIEEVSETHLGYGDTLTMTMDVPAEQIESVVMVRNPSQTHVINADQRNVELPVVERSGNQLTVQVTDNNAVLPPGPYMLFANKTTDEGLVPSEAAQTFVGLDSVQPGIAPVVSDAGPAEGGAETAPLPTPDGGPAGGLLESVPDSPVGSAVPGTDAGPTSQDDGLDRAEVPGVLRDRVRSGSGRRPRRATWHPGRRS